MEVTLDHLLQSSDNETDEQKLRFNDFMQNTKHNFCHQKVSSIVTYPLYVLSPLFNGIFWDLNTYYGKRKVFMPDVSGTFNDNILARMTIPTFWFSFYMNNN